MTGPGAGEIPGERLEAPVDPRELHVGVGIVGVLAVGSAGILLWPAIRAWSSGEPVIVEASTWRSLLWLAGSVVLLGVVVLRAGHRTAGTTFTSEGVWQPGWLGGGRFCPWDAVEEVDYLPRGAGMSHLRLAWEGGTMRIRLTAYRRPREIAALVKRHVDDRVMEPLPPADDG